jgi:hypothetical protein
MSNMHSKFPHLVFFVLPLMLLVSETVRAEEKRLGNISDAEMNYIQRGSHGNVLECWLHELAAEETRLKSKGIDPQREIVVGFDQDDMPSGTLSISLWNINQNIHCEPASGSRVELTNYEGGERFLLCRDWYPGCY